MCLDLQRDTSNDKHLFFTPFGFGIREMIPSSGREQRRLQFLGRFLHLLRQRVAVAVESERRLPMARQGGYDVYGDAVHQQQ